MDSAPRKGASEELVKDLTPRDPGLKKSPLALDKFRQPAMIAMRKEVVLFAERYSQTAAAKNFGLSRNIVMLRTEPSPRAMLENSQKLPAVLAILLSLLRQNGACVIA